MKVDGWDEDTILRTCVVFGVSVEEAIALLNKQLEQRENLQRHYGAAILPILRKIADKISQMTGG